MVASDSLGVKKDGGFIGSGESQKRIRMVRSSCSFGLIS